MRSTTTTTTTMRWIGAGILGFLLVAASSCGGAASGGPSAAATPPAAWGTLTKEARAQYMRDVIVPRMGELFRAFAPTKFAGFGCSTCHGASAADGVFTMPNPSLVTLPMNSAGFQSLMREKPDWMRFMGQQVRPQMAALLGLPELDMAHPTPDQFGCRNCHSMRQVQP
jgi:hypothetical protein